MVDLKTPKGHFEINWPLVTQFHQIKIICTAFFQSEQKILYGCIEKVLQIWAGKQKMLLSWHFYLQFTKNNWVSTSENWITLRNLDFFYSPRLKAPKKIKRTMFFWYKQFWTKPWKKMDWSTSFFCNLSSKQQITPNLILGKEVYKALNCFTKKRRQLAKK